MIRVLRTVRKKKIPLDVQLMMLLVISAGLCFAGWHLLLWCIPDLDCMKELARWV